MFHAIKARLADLARRIRDYRLADDLYVAADHGWTAVPGKRGAVVYRDPRFDNREDLLAERSIAPVSRPTWAQAAITDRIATLPMGTSERRKAVQ